MNGNTATANDEMPRATESADPPASRLFESTGGSAVHLYARDETRRAEHSSVRSFGAGEFVERTRSPTTGHGLDRELLRKAREIVDSIATDDAFNMQLFLTALAGTVAEMWTSAMQNSEWHQDILATLESAVKTTEAEGAVNEEQLRFFREAITDLGQQTLVQQNAAVVRSEFVRQGFPSLGFAE